MSGRGKRKGTRSGNIAITVGDLSLEADAVIDVTAQYQWKARPVKEIRLGKRAEVFRDIVTNSPEVTIGDDICSYAGGSGFDSRGYYVLVEKVGQKVRTSPQAAAAPQEAPQTSHISEPATQAELLQPQAPPATEPLSGPLPVPGDPVPETIEAAAPDRYSQLTLEEYEAMPMSDAAKVPADIVERLHAHHETPTDAGDQPEADNDISEELRRLLAGEQAPEPGAGQYSEMTLEEYEAMPMSEAAKVPPEVVEKLRRSSKNIGGEQ